MHKKQTPLMKQYYEIKAKYPNTVLLFRVGDFYETFEEDAHTLHKVTNVKLTKRSNGAAAAVALAGFPHHALDLYIPKLLKAGLRVSICDQVDVPQKGTTLVSRKVTEVITPGLTYHDHVLEQKQNNYLASLHWNNQVVGVALLDISTGEFLATQGTLSYIQQLFQGFEPAEVIFNVDCEEAYRRLVQKEYPHHKLPEWVYETQYGHQRLRKHFHTQSLKGFGLEDMPEAIVAAGAVLRYLEETDQKHLGHITQIARLDQQKYVWLDKFTIRDLELLHPQQGDGLSLLHILDCSATPMGSRQLKKRILFPLKNKGLIEERLANVGALVQNSDENKRVGEYLKPIGDLERLISKVASQRINPRELYTLSSALMQIIPLKKILKQPALQPLGSLGRGLDPCHTLTAQIQRYLQPTPPLQVNQGGLIQKGISETLDSLREIAFESNVHLQKMQKKEREATGISSLKIGYNKVFGYFLEVTHTHRDKVPEHWIRKQTLVNAERYITEELKSYEEQILDAQERINVLEQQLYQALVEEATRYITPIQKNARLLGALDCYYSLALVAKRQRYIRPSMHEGEVIDIKGGRHPVIEANLPVGNPYVPNDTYLDDDRQILLITGPNMAGKSAFLRQVALIVLMAHVGSFVPATQATIGVRDKIFSRVGASDNISNHESTFMVEMNEMASIINNLSAQSLVIVDELGRGTGTADGMALAQSVIEYVHNHPRHHAKMLFATHYHELNELAERLSKLKNYKVLVKQMGEKIVFMHRLVAGSSQNSFGIEVAKMAGLPRLITDRAEELIAPIKEKKEQESLSIVRAKPTMSPYQLSFWNPSQLHERLMEVLVKVDPERVTPVEALMKLVELKQIIRQESGQKG